MHWNRKHLSVFEFRVEKNGITPSMPQELLFELNGARVTPHIATFGGTSYQIANIGNVHVVRRRRYNPFAMIIFLLGLGILAAAIVKSRATGLRRVAPPMFAVRIRPQFGRRAKLAKVRSISPASARELMELNSTPNDAANWIAPHWPLPAALLGSRSTATCRTAGATSLSNSSRFATIP